MNMQDLPQAIKDCIAADLCIYIEGPSGCGKSELVRQVSDDLDYRLVDMRLAYRDLVDMHGLPIPDLERAVTDWLIPRDFKDHPTDTRKPLYFFDELPHAASAVQAVMYEIICERTVAGHKLPLGAAFVAAGNRVTDKGIHNRRPTPLRRRMIEVKVKEDIISWSHWAIAYGIDAVRVAYLNWRPEHLFTEYIGEERGSDPRGWVFLDRLLKTAKSVGEVRDELIRGTVGEVQGNDYLAFERLKDSLVPMAEILAHPDTAEVPHSNPGATWAIAAGLSHHANAANFGKILTYLKRLPKELEIMAVKASQIKTPSVRSTQAFQRWALDNHEIMGV